jgi:hypothetical protein
VTVADSSGMVNRDEVPDGQISKFRLSEMLFKERKLSESIGRIT